MFDQIYINAELLFKKNSNGELADRLYQDVDIFLVNIFNIIGMDKEVYIHFETDNVTDDMKNKVEKLNNLKGRKDVLFLSYGNDFEQLDGLYLTNQFHFDKLEQFFNIDDFQDAYDVLMMLYNENAKLEKVKEKKKATHLEVDTLTYTFERSKDFIKVVKNDKNYQVTIVSDYNEMDFKKQMVQVKDDRYKKYYKDRNKTSIDKHLQEFIREIFNLYRCRLKIDFVTH